MTQMPPVQPPAASQPPPSGPQKKECALGLTQTGLILFIVLLVCCVPLCWLPWVIKDFRAQQ